MHNPVEIALRGIPASTKVERYIDEQARKLDSVCDRIRSCQVVVEALPRERQRGAQIAVRLIITLPGTEVVVNREHDDDVYTAVRDAFAAAGLQLKDYMRRQGALEGRAQKGTPGRG
jgi:ribosome-associated translation inhibitor RaiA